MRRMSWSWRRKEIRELSSADRARWLAQCDVGDRQFPFRSRLAVSKRRDLDWGLRLCVATVSILGHAGTPDRGPTPVGNCSAPGGPESHRRTGQGGNFLGALATLQGDYPPASDFLNRSLSLYEELGENAGIAVSLNALAVWREIEVTTPRRRAILSEVSRAGVCCRTGWQSRVVFTTWPCG